MSIEDGSVVASLIARDQARTVAAVELLKQRFQLAGAIRFMRDKSMSVALRTRCETIARELGKIQELLS